MSLQEAACISDNTFKTDIAEKGWRVASVEPPQPGFIVKRWKSGAMWAGFFDGNPKFASCDYWYPLPHF